METVVMVAIGVLATIFLASFAALLAVCRQRYCHPRGLLQCYDIKPGVDLIGAMETQSEPSELELDNVVITNPHIEAILENEDWVEDASGLVSHCIAILKICHTLTEKLVAMTMGSGAKMKPPASLSDIIVVAKRISPRVDDVVRSMYPPLDPKLLDASTWKFFVKRLWPPSQKDPSLEPTASCRSSQPSDGWADGRPHLGHLRSLWAHLGSERSKAHPRSHCPGTPTPFIPCPPDP
ncbi:transmembrane protein 98 isoform X2 [Ornithorhynchus anatinus]|uniref:transmembrane protein 98 isoform X2 n=1 Tax=Ornithorhynchus anatinus TaxID=9258 RepID=UPI0010A818CA|nr:transmembrane protein 98 isoform X2 [Ornithorhynchus anatinus]